MYYSVQAYFFDGWTHLYAFPVSQPLDWCLWLDFLLVNSSIPLRFGFYDDDLRFHIVARNAFYGG